MYASYPVTRRRARRTRADAISQSYTADTFKLVVWRISAVGSSLKAYFSLLQKTGVAKTKDKDAHAIFFAFLPRQADGRFSPGI